MNNERWKSSYKTVLMKFLNRRSKVYRRLTCWIIIIAIPEAKNDDIYSVVLLICSWLALILSTLLSSSYLVGTKTILKRRYVWPRYFYMVMWSNCRDLISGSNQLANGQLVMWRITCDRITVESDSGYFCDLIFRSGKLVVNGHVTT